MHSKAFAILTIGLIVLMVCSVLITAQNQGQTETGNATGTTTDISVTSTILVIIVTALVVSGILGYGWLSRKQ